MKLFIISLICIILPYQNIKAQTLLTEGFEAPITGWYSEGMVVASQNSILPYSGTAMMALGRNERITSPNISLPVGSKTLSFYMNGYNPYSLLGFSMEVQLMQFGNPSLLLGTFSDVNTWGQNTVTIPSGYTGSNYSIDFHILNYSTTYSDFRFYLDNILLELNSAIGISEMDGFDNYYELSLQDGKLIVESKLMAELFFIELVTIDGRIVSKSEFKTNSATEINTNDLSSGLYLIHVYNEKKSFVKKIFL